MRAINISNEKKRNAEVGFASLSGRETINMVLADGRERTNVKIIKTLFTDEQLKDQYGWDMIKLGEALIADDPEFDLELTGRFIQKTYRLWMTADSKIAYRVNFTELVCNPDGSEKERRELKKKQANINIEDAVRWTGQSFPKEEILRKFVFTRSYHLHHTSGLTFDFLYDMAKQLHETKSLMRVGAGKNGKEQLCMSEGGEKYHGFLEGRIDGDKYCLILHLTNLELKPLATCSAASRAKGEKS